MNYNLPTNDPSHKTVVCKYQWNPESPYHVQNWTQQDLTLMVPILLSLKRIVWVKDPESDSIWCIKDRRDLSSVLLNLFSNRLSARSPEK
jgi:hypothetical protein